MYLTFIILQKYANLERSMSERLELHGLSRMDVVNPEVLRVTPVFRALERFALALRFGSDEDLYPKSRKSTKISYILESPCGPALVCPGLPGPALLSRASELRF